MNHICKKLKDKQFCNCTLPDNHTGPCSCGQKHDKICHNGHVFAVDCAELETGVCPRPCEKQLRCGHRCPGTCGECVPPPEWKGLSDAEYMIHRRCSNQCGRNLPCGHTCKDGCGNACPPCSHPCDFSCGHGSPCRGNHECSSCTRRCSEKCLWSCPHYQCHLKCCEPCTRPRCDERCTKLLPCGHQCFGLCGEECPVLCPPCFLGENGEEAQAVQQAEAEKVSIDNTYFFDSDDVTAFCSGEMDGKEYRPIYLRCCGRYSYTIFLDNTYQAFVEAHNVDQLRCPFCNRPLHLDSIRRYSATVLWRRDKGFQVVQLQLQERAAALSQNRMTITRLMNYIGSSGGMTEQMMERTIPELVAIWEHDDKRQQVEKCGKHSALSQWKLQGFKLRVTAKEMFKVKTSKFSGKKFYKHIILWVLSAPAEFSCVRDMANAFLVYLAFETPSQEPLPLLMAYTLQTVEVYTNYLLSKVQFSDDSVCKQLALTVQWLCGIVHNFTTNENTTERAVNWCKHKQVFLQQYLSVPQKFISKKVDEGKLREMAETMMKQILLLADRDLLRMLASATQLSSGHWFLCECGMPYAIADCGGATIVSTCPNCKRRIGGSNHNLDSSSRFGGFLLDDNAAPAFGYYLGNNRRQDEYAARQR